MFKIMGGQDKEGFAMKQGVLTNGRVRLLMHQCEPFLTPARRLPLSASHRLRALARAFVAPSAGAHRASGVLAAARESAAASPCAAALCPRTWRP